MNTLLKASSKYFWLQGDELDPEKTHENPISANLSKVYRNPLFLLTLITVGITFYLLMVQIKIGVPYFDVFNYLNNALYFAGMGKTSNVLYLPPAQPILTSLFFRMGYVSINAIFILDSILFIIGVIGLYLLLKQRFNEIQSFAGSIIFISLPVVISWAASGGIDLPGVTLSIWTIYFTVLGVKKDSRFLYLVLPLTMLAFLTRYTAGLILLPVLLYFLINIKNVNNVKKVISGVLIEIVVLIGAFLFFYTKIGTAKNFYSLLLYVTTSQSVGVGDVAYNTNTLYYIQNILNYISVGPFTGTYVNILNPSGSAPSILAYIIALMVLVGLSFYIYRILNSKIGLKMDKFSITKIILLIVLITGFIITFNNVSYVISEISFFLICYISYLLLKNSKNMGLDFMFLAWFGAYLIFQSILPLKVDRYFITMAPAFAYFIILGLSEFMDKIKPKIKNKNLRSWGIYSIIALIFLSSATATYIGHTPKKCFTLDIGDASNWLKEYDPGYKDRIIYSDYQPAVSWYLKRGTNGGFPVYITKTRLYSKMLLKNNVDYYIDSLSNPKPDLEGYHIIKNINNIAIYEKNK